MVAARIIVGVGEASYATLAPTIIDDLAPPARKNKWLSVFYVAIPVGAALGVEARHGWRVAFYVVGAPGLVLALACLLIREPERRRAPRERTPARVYWDLAQRPVYRASVIGYTAYTFALGGFSIFAPTYLEERFGMKLEAANQGFGAIILGTGLVATFVGGWLGDRWRGPDRPRANLALCGLSCAVACVLSAVALLAPTKTGFFLAMTGTQFALFLATSPINVVILGAVPEELRASAMAASIFTIHLLGDLISPPIVGYLERFMPLASAMLILPAALAIGAIVWIRGSKHPLTSGAESQ
jgi:MFS family permease